MRIQLITVGHKMPAWVTDVGNDYIKRFGSDIQWQIDEIPAPARGKNADIPRLMQKEAELIQQKCLKGSFIVALDVKGKEVSTEQLADQLGNWMGQGTSLTLIIGGADGIHPELLAKANAKISLSKLTFPHPLARVVLIEQIYRAYTILNNHPYHRR